MWIYFRGNLFVVVDSEVAVVVDEAELKLPASSLGLHVIRV